MIKSTEKMSKVFLAGKRKLHFFDANCWIGKTDNFFGLCCNTAGELIKQMDYYGIEKAIVSHTMARNYHPGVGNEFLLKEIRGITRLIGCFTLLPAQTKELELLSRYIDNMITRGVRAVRIFPASHGFSTNDSPSAILLGKIEERRIPLLIWSKEIHLKKLYRICKEHPRLPVILEQPEEDRYLDGQFLFLALEKYRAIMDECENFFIEVHNLILCLEVDTLVRRFGSEKLIFGSYLPMDDPNASLMMITHGEFSFNDKKNIAHKNLHELIDGVVTRSERCIQVSQ